jgi:hypothetical protein
VACRTSGVRIPSAPRNGLHVQWGRFSGSDLTFQTRLRSRRERIEGSIDKDEAKGRWYAAISVGYGPDKRHDGRTSSPAAPGQVAEKLSSSKPRRTLASSRRRLARRGSGQPGGPDGQAQPSRPQAGHRSHRRHRAAATFRAKVLPAGRLRLSCLQAGGPQFSEDARYPLVLVRAPGLPLNRACMRQVR